MKTEVGEQLVGAYLKLVKECEFISYNVRPNTGGLEGLGEMDVIGFDYPDDTVYICEVVTHLRGTLYKNYDATITKIKEKHSRQKKYAAKYLKDFSIQVFQLWSPVVPRGALLDQMRHIEGIDVVVNEDYARCVDELLELAKTRLDDTGNDVFRVFQILGALRR
jgi:hypothetical protein